MSKITDSERIQILKSRIAGLEEELKAAKAAEAAERQARLDATPIQQRFFIAEDTSQHDRLYDPTMKKYRLVMVITNKTAAEVPPGYGHRVDTDGAGMTYLWNPLSQRIVMQLGGGHIWIGGFNRIHEDTLTELNAFLTENPAGGEITDIVNQDKAREGRS